MGTGESSERRPESEALEDPQGLLELQESFGRLENFRHWCKQYERECLLAVPKTIGLYFRARSTLERRLAAIASLDKEGHESPAPVAEG